MQVHASFTVSKIQMIVTNGSVSGPARDGGCVDASLFRPHNLWIDETAGTEVVKKYYNQQKLLQVYTHARVRSQLHAPTPIPTLITTHEEVLFGKASLRRPRPPSYLTSSCADSHTPIAMITGRPVHQVVASA